MRYISKYTVCLMLKFYMVRNEIKGKNEACQGALMEKGQETLDRSLHPCQ